MVSFYGKEQLGLHILSYSTEESHTDFEVNDGRFIFLSIITIVNCYVYNIT